MKTIVEKLIEDNSEVMKRYDTERAIFTRRAKAICNILHDLKTVEFIAREALETLQTTLDYVRSDASSTDFIDAETFMTLYEMETKLLDALNYVYEYNSKTENTIYAHGTEFYDARIETGFDTDLDSSTDSAIVVQKAKERADEDFITWSDGDVQPLSSELIF